MRKCFLLGLTLLFYAPPPAMPSNLAFLKSYLMGYICEFKLSSDARVFRPGQAKHL